MSISASEARKTLFPLIERVNNDRDAIEIVSRKGNAVLMAADEYTAWQETDRRILNRINTLIDACLREPFSGIGKPEQLKYGAQGSWVTSDH